MYASFTRDFVPGCKHATSRKRDKLYGVADKVLLLRKNTFYYSNYFMCVGNPRLPPPPAGGYGLRPTKSEGKASNLQLAIPHSVGQSLQLATCNLQPATFSPIPNPQNDPNIPITPSFTISYFLRFSGLTGSTEGASTFSGSTEYPFL